MNKICISLLISSAAAVSLDSIPAESIMQNNPSHWRKAWPEGAVDNGDEDAGVINDFLYPIDEKLAKQEPKETYPWSYDEDVIATQRSIETAAKITGHELSHEATKNGGLDMISVYDNTKTVFESGLPYGATWKDPRYNGRSQQHGNGGHQ